ncbi:MAG TPA: hypothetical protein VME24_10890 [Alphaproteobacteria bacterium]|nr:hypothetical protein [Alphaproteobacteria bacterium]
MKRTIVMLAVATASMVVFAQPPQNAQPAGNSTPAQKSAATPAAITQPSVPLVKKESAQAPPQHIVSTPLMSLTRPVVPHKVWSVDGMSSRPWMQTVGMRPGFPVLPPPEEHQSSLYLFWIGRDPH